MFFLEKAYEEAYYLADCGCIPMNIAELTSLAYNSIRVIVPIVLILIGIVTLMSTFMSQKEDEIKKAQSKLVQKVVAAVIVFLITTIVRFSVGLVSDTMTTEQEDDLWECVNYMLTRENKENMVRVKESECRIIDGSDPVIVAGSRVVSLNDYFDPLAGVSASDMEDGDVTSKIVVTTNNVNTSSLGSYDVVYEVVDNDGNKTIRTIIITVVNE